MTAPLTDGVRIDTAMFNRVALRVGDEADVCRWGLSDEDKAAAEELVPVETTDADGGVVFVEERSRGEDSRVMVVEVLPVVERCSRWREPHVHVMAEGKKRGVVERCSGVLSPWRRRLEVGDSVRFKGKDHPVTHVDREKFIVRKGEGPKRRYQKILWKDAMGIVHHDGLELGRPPAETP